MSYGRGDFGGLSGAGGYSTYQSADRRDSSSEFTRLSQVTSSNIQKITQNVGTIQRNVNKMGTSEDNHDLREKLHELQHYTNQLAKDTNRYLKDLQSLPPAVSESDQRQRKMQKERLTSEFTSVLNNFQAIQRKAAEKEKEEYARVRAASGRGSDLRGPFDDDRESQLISLESPGSRPVPSQMMLEEDVDMEALRERETALRKLESDITDVNQIFKDLATMVHEQGEMVDSIEANVESAGIHVEDGNTQLRQARDYQKKARRKMVIFIIVLLVIIAIVALIIYLSVK
ncbi:syntaxin-12-like isoform X2 [Glandiceps talaboti]